MKIGNVDLDEEVLIVAEIGNNHEGSYTLAEEMIGLAAEAGAGAVKFQTIVPERLVSPLDTARIEQLKKFQLSYHQFEKLKDVAEAAGVMFLSTPFDIESAKFLEALVPAYKIASGDNDFFPLIETLALTGKPLILSTGLTSFSEIAYTNQFIKKIWCRAGIEQELALLHCVVSYPTDPIDGNLLVIETLKQLSSTVGYSDHTLGTDAAVLAVALGARIIEKHFTIDKNYSDFRDHQLSSDPKELAQLVTRIGDTLTLLGNSQKQVQANELSIGHRARRSIIVNKNLQAGHIITWADLDWVRPGDNLRPGDERHVVGKKLVIGLNKGDIITAKNVA